MGYEKYKLSTNPFPGTPIINPESSDPKDNGSIFSVNARSKEIDEFEHKFIGKKTIFEDRIRCGFLWAEGDSTTGRGMGKTSLAIYMKHKINNGYGSIYFDNKKRFFCSYLSFNQQIGAKLGLFIQEALNSLIKDGIFDEVSRCTNADSLINQGVDSMLAQSIVNNSVRGYFEGILHHKLEMRLASKDWRQDPILKDIFLNQTTKCLKAAGFNGGILLIDDLENLTDKSTKKEIETFIKDFGLSFFRAGNEASTSKFYTTILTTHINSARKISEAWTVAGLSGAFPLNPKGHASLLTRKPDLEQCMDIVRQHLLFYRDPSFKLSNEFYPFTIDAIKTVIQECHFHPRIFLSRFNRIIIEALGKDIEEITPEFAKTVPEAEEEEETLGIEDL